jgi:hypothetical protein
MMNMKAVVGLVCVAAALSVAAADSTYIVKRLPPDSAITIDGKLDEGAWKGAAQANIIRMYKDTDLEAPPHTAYAKAMWDSTNLYIAYVTEDDTVWATKTQHDNDLHTEEVVEFFFDPDADGKKYIEFHWNCLGTTLDYYFEEAPQIGKDVAWSAPSEKSEVVVHGTPNVNADIDTGMVVEARFPWTDFTDISPELSLPPKHGDKMAGNFTRVEQPVDHSTVYYISWSWVGPDNSGGFHDAAYWGTLQISDSLAVSGSVSVQPRRAESVELRGAREVSPLRALVRMQGRMVADQQANLAGQRLFDIRGRALSAARFRGPSDGVYVSAARH